jgi:hypothetical protein
MRIMLKAPIYGAWTGKPGCEVDRPDAEALRLIAGGFAVPVKPVETLETTNAKDSKSNETR